MKIPEKRGGAGVGRICVGALLLFMFWGLDAAIDVSVFQEAGLYTSLFEPSPHELVDRLLVLLLAGYFIVQGARASRVRAELEGALHEALFRAESERARSVAIVEAMGDAISIQDTEMRVLYQNRAHQELTGSHAGERCYEAYAHKSEICPDCRLVRAFDDGGVHRGEVNFPSVQSARCYEAIVSVLRDPAGRISAGIQVVRDITDRKHAEQAATKEAALLQHLIDTIPNPIYHQDLSGRFLWCNTAFARWLAKPRELLVGRTISEVAPEQVCRVFLENEPGPGEGTVHECHLRRSDGELCDVIFYKSMFSDADGDEAGVVGVIVEITERKRAEDEIVGLNAALMQQALELNQANRDLKAFSHAVSHDLRTPLTRVYSSGQGLQEYAKALDANGLFFVKSINDGCVQIEALLDALLVLSRVTEMTLSTAPVDLSLIAQEKATELQRLEPGRRVTFRIAPRLRVQGDPQLLYIALENLIGNAWKYTARVPEALIELGSFVCSDGERIFFLKDNGAGFDAERMDQLFKPFQRLHAPQEFPGTGLGLATVRRIVRRHNGRVWAEGKPGCGAAFYFTLNL